MPRPKEVVTTGAAARGSKNGITFVAEIKSSSPVKYKHIHPLWHYLRIQSLKLGTNLVSARWILERAFSPSIVTEVGIRIAPLLYKEEKTLWWHGTAWLCGRFGWVYQVEKNHPVACG